MCVDRPHIPKFRNPFSSTENRDFRASLQIWQILISCEWEKNYLRVLKNRVGKSTDFGIDQKDRDVFKQECKIYFC